MIDIFWGLVTETKTVIAAVLAVFSDELWSMVITGEMSHFLGSITALCSLIYVVRGHYIREKKNKEL